MKTKKGIIVTIIILGAITGASFLIWTIPQKSDPIFVVTDFKGELDRVKEIHQSLESSIEEKFQETVDGKISPDEYIQMAEVTTSQTNAQIIELVESGASEEWQQSYIEYINALKGFNTYVRETLVVAHMKKDGGSQESINESLEKIQSLKQDMDSMIRLSDEARP